MYTKLLSHSLTLIVNGHTFSTPSLAGNAPLPKESQEPLASDHESETGSVSVTVVKAEVFVNKATETSFSEEQCAIRAEIRTQARIPTDLPLKATNSQADDQDDAEPLYTPVLKRNLEGDLLESMKEKIDVEDLEDFEDEIMESNKPTNSSVSVASTEDRSGQVSATATSSTGSNQIAPEPGLHSVSLTVFNEPHQTKSLKRVDERATVSGTVLQNNEETESEKRLSALKDAWESADTEDVAYLQVVL